MNVDPFWLNDRIVPSDANDPKEVTRLGQALSDVGEDVADRSRPAVTEAVRRFQDSRGLRVDGEAQVNGPTAQRLAAERHERQTAARPSAQQRILGEQHSVPVRDAVGTGGRNRPEDRRSVMQALAIGNYLSRYAALNPVDLPPGAPDPELETALARFRRKQGVRETGPLAPGSLTLRLLNQITAPRLHQLIGDDVASPRDMSPAEDPAVVRDSPDSPTARAVPFRDEGQVAHETAQDQEIARRQADRIRQEMAAVDRGEAAPVPGTDPSLQALHDDPELKDLTARQIDRIREIATESALDLEQPETRARLGAYMREKEPDFLTALQEKYEAGKLDARKLERLTENWARQVSTHGASPISVARLKAGTEVLRQALQDEGASAADTVAKIEKLMAGAGQGEPEVPLLFEFFPGLGEALSAADAAKYLAQAQAADAAGNTAEANAAWNAFALAAAGAVPFVGKAVKLLRHVKVVRKAEEAITSAAAPVLNAITEQARKTKVVQKAEELVDAQRARRKLLKAEEDFETEFEGMSAQELVGAADWSKLDEKTQHAISSSFTHGKRRASEGQLATDLDVAGAKRPLDGPKHDHLYMVRTDDGEWLPRKFDSVAYGWFRPTLMGLWVRKIDEGKAFAIELKSGSSKLTKDQARADKAIADGRDSFPTLSKNGGQNGYTLPEIEKDIKHLRIPLWAIPQDMLNEDLRKSLTNKGTPERVRGGPTNLDS
ncbi:hypothetical protein [Minwuia sp. IMCC3077]|nr:hypothetical protein [Minwuia sp. IMCC3077]